MSITHKAGTGESLCGIAYQNGYDYCTELREEASNAFIVNRKINPCQVLPGDVVTIPGKVAKEVDGVTEKVHKFVKRGRLASIRFCRGVPDKSGFDDSALPNLNVSNYQTDKAGIPDGDVSFPGDSDFEFDSSAHQDQDAFKVEVFDIRESGEVDVEVEALRPIYDSAGEVIRHEAFPAPRKIEPLAAGQRKGSFRFLTPYLRLVTDEEDKFAALGQTLLTSDMYGEGDEQVEILDQIVRSSYEIPSCPEVPGCRVSAEVPIGTDRRRLRINVLILNEKPGGAPVVDGWQAERRIYTWLRRIYAQISISPKLILPIREEDPPANLISISNDLGTRARGNGIISFTIHAPGIASQLISLETKFLAKPIKTANAILAQVAPPFFASVSENPALFKHRPSRKSADIVITAEGGKRVTISDESCTDSGHTISVGRPDPFNFVMGSSDSFLAGSIEERTVLKNYDSGDDRFDLVVINKLAKRGKKTFAGHSNMSGHKLDKRRRAISKVKWSGFVDFSSVNSEDSDPAVIAHEIMHAAGEVMHTLDSPTQLMDPDGANVGVLSAKRIRDGLVDYNGGKISGKHNLANRVRAEGQPLLEPW